MASVPEKYKTTISEMKADAEAAINSAQSDYEAKKKERMNLETQLKELERIRKENYSKFWKVAVDFVKLLITNFFKKHGMTSFARAINPVNEYIKYSNWIEDTQKQLQEARSEEENAQYELKAAKKLLASIVAIEG